MQNTLIATILVFAAICHSGMMTYTENVTFVNLLKLNETITIIIQKQNVPSICARTTVIPVKNQPYIIDWITIWNNAQTGGPAITDWYLNDNYDFVTQSGKLTGISLKALQFNSVIKLITWAGSTLKNIACGYIEQNGTPDAQQLNDLNSFCNETTLLQSNHSNCDLN